MDNADYPKVDVLFPFHRNDEYLKLAFKSLRASRGVSIRIIAIDDRVESNPISWIPNDNCVVVRSGGVGYSKALQIGKKYVESPFVAFQDSDDLTDPLRIMKQIQKINKDGLDICCCFMLKINENSHPKLIQSPKFQYTQNSDFQFLLGSYNSNSTWVLKSPLLSDKRFFDPNYQSIDWATTLAVISDLRIGCLEEDLYYYRQHSSQMTSSVLYHQSAFSELFPLWSRLNAKLLLPELDQNHAERIGMGRAIRVSWDDECIKWSRNFLDKVKNSDKRNYTNSKLVLMVRAARQEENAFIRLWKKFSYLTLLLRHPRSCREILVLPIRYFGELRRLFLLTRDDLI